MSSVLVPHLCLAFKIMPLHWLIRKVIFPLEELTASSQVLITPHSSKQNRPCSKSQNGAQTKKPTIRRIFVVMCNGGKERCFAASEGEAS